MSTPPQPQQAKVIFPSLANSPSLSLTHSLSSSRLDLCPACGHAAPNLGQFRPPPAAPLSPSCPGCPLTATITHLSNWDTPPPPCPSPAGQSTQTPAAAPGPPGSPPLTPILPLVSRIAHFLLFLALSFDQAPRFSAQQQRPMTAHFLKTQNLSLPLPMPAQHPPQHHPVATPARPQSTNPRPVPSQPRLESRKPKTDIAGYHANPLLTPFSVDEPTISLSSSVDPFCSRKSSSLTRISPPGLLQGRRTGPRQKTLKQRFVGPPLRT